LAPARTLLGGRRLRQRDYCVRSRALRGSSYIAGKGPGAVRPRVLRKDIVDYGEGDTRFVVMFDEVTIEAGKAHGMAAVAPGGEFSPDRLEVLGPLGHGSATAD
jgi:hypothetical protein